MTAPRTTKTAPRTKPEPKTTKKATLPPRGVAVAPTFDQIALDQISPSSYNPRTRFDEASLAELANSIKEQGVLEPILVRPYDEGGYEIMAGERRFRAAQLAGLATIPAIVRIVTEEEARLIAVTENRQRHDLDALDTARGYQILKEGGMAQADIAQKCGVSPGEVSKALVLLQTPPAVQELIREEKLSASAARLIWGKLAKFEGFAIAYAKYVATAGMSMRELEDSLKDGGRLPYAFTYKVLESAARQVEWNTPFKAECQQCPHGAYLSNLCLMPAEFDRKMGEIRAAEEAEAKALAEAYRVSRQERGKALPMAEGEEAPALPVLGKDIAHGKYEMIHPGGPKECSVDCECRCLARLPNGSRTVQVCLDPARLQKLKAAQTRAENKVLKEEGKKRIEQVLKLNEGSRETMGRAYALALRRVLSGIPTAARRAALPMLPTATTLDIVRNAHFDAIREAFDNNGTSAPWEQVQARLARAMGEIAPIERNAVFLAAASAIAIGSLHEQIEEPRYKSASEAKFLLGEEAKTEGKEAANA